MKFLLAIVAALALATTVSACPVAVQSFGTCGVAAQAVVQQQVFHAPVAVAVPQVAFVQQFAAVPICHSTVLALGHCSGARVQVFGGHRARVQVFGGRQVVRQRQVVRGHGW